MSMAEGASGCMEMNNHIEDHSTSNRMGYIPQGGVFKEISMFKRCEASASVLWF